MGVMLLIEFAVLMPFAWDASRWHWSLDSPLSYVFFVVGMAWLGAPGKLLWPIPIAAALLLIPTYFVSVRIERPFYRRSFSATDPRLVERAVSRANTFSYLFLFIAALAWLGWRLYTRV